MSTWALGTYVPPFFYFQGLNDKALKWKNNWQTDVMAVMKTAVVAALYQVCPVPTSSCMSCYVNYGGLALKSVNKLNG